MTEEQPFKQIHAEIKSLLQDIQEAEENGGVLTDEIKAFKLSAIEFIEQYKLPTEI